MALPAPKERYEKLRMMLVEAREAAGLTPVELAARLDRPQSFGSKIERGIRKMDVIGFIEIAHAIGFAPATSLRKLDKLIIP
jgi:transcriptional regulator with XRE-family HTH domain